MPFKNKSDYTEYMRNYMKKRWTSRRKEAVWELGGVCDKCGGEDNLEFDHKNPKRKNFTLADLTSKNDDDFWKEVMKCRLLCRECHYKHTGDQNRAKAKKRKKK